MSIAMDKEKELIDIVVPIWNCEKYIEPFFDYIMRQTYQNFRIHFGYDQSDDRSLEELKKKQNEYPDKVFIYYIPIQSGLGPARDYVLDNAELTGKYLIFLDIDDYADDNFLEVMIKTAVEYDTDLTICGLTSFDDQTGKVINTQMTNCPEEVITNVKNFTDIAYMNPGVWNKLYKRETIENYRFGRAKNVEDGLYLLRVLPSINSIKFINLPLFHYRVSDSSAQARLTPDKFNICWQYYEELSEWYKERYETYKDYYSIYELQMFVKCGLGLTHRVAFKDIGHAGAYEKYSREKMDALAPGWRNNKQLKMSGWRKRSAKANIVAFCATLYKVHMFKIFIYFYWLLKKVTIKDVRW